MPPYEHKYPAIESGLADVRDVPTLQRIVDALRERTQIYARERGRMEDSMVRVSDLLALGLITQADLRKLPKR